MPGLIDAQPQQASSVPPAQPSMQTPAQGQPGAIAATKAKTFQVQKIALAAQKVMYGEKTGKEFMKSLQGDDVVSMTANAATNVMLLLISESQLKINPELIIPAGVVVVGDIMDFIEKARGIQHTDDDVEAAIEMFVKQIMSAVGGDQQPQQVMQPQPTEGMM